MAFSGITQGSGPRGSGPLCVRPWGSSARSPSLRRLCPHRLFNRTPRTFFRVGPETLQGEAWGGESARLAPPLPNRYSCPDLSRAQTEQPASRCPVSASIVSARGVKRTRCESINCPVAGSLGKTRLLSLPPIEASLAALRSPAARRTRGPGRVPSPGASDSGAPVLRAPPTRAPSRRVPRLSGEGLGSWARLSPPPSPHHLIVDPAHASRAVVLIKLRGIGRNVVRGEHFCLIRSSWCRQTAQPPPAPARLPPTLLAAAHTHSRGPPRAARSRAGLTCEHAWGVDASPGGRTPALSSRNWGPVVWA